VAAIIATSKNRREIRSRAELGMVAARSIRVRRPDQGPRGSDLRLIASSGRSRCLRRVGCLQRHLASELSDFPFQMTVSYRRGD
jgi:hypothetical protein